MYAAVSSLKGIIKVGPVTTDNLFFKLHYKFTTLLLVVFSVVVSTNQFFGDPIDCFTSQPGEIPSNVLDNYCWVQGTFTLPDSVHKQVGKEVIYPGVDQLKPDSERVYHNYYQWVCFFLFLEAIFFYIPHFCWKLLEGGKMKQILLGLNDPIPKDGGKPCDPECNMMALTKHIKESAGHNSLYSYGFVVCEVANAVNVIGQIFFTDCFLGGEFTTYGTKVIDFANNDQSNRTDPMIEVFPRMTKCTFRKYGAAGSIQEHGALCILPINMINEKVFIFLWFWFIILAVFSALALMYRAFLILSYKLRTKSTFLRRLTNDQKDLYRMFQELSYSDWFVLDLLGKNMNTLHFRNLIAQLAQPKPISPSPKTNSITEPLISKQTEAETSLA